MVKLIRYIGLEELVSLENKGYIKPKQVLYNKTAGAGKLGRYWFRKVYEDILQESKERALYLFGVITENKLPKVEDFLLCIEAEISEEELEAGEGIYHDTHSDDWFALQTVPEFYSKNYNKDQVLSVSFLQVDGFNISYMRQGSPKEIINYLKERSE